MAEPLLSEGGLGADGLLLLLPGLLFLLIGLIFLLRPISSHADRLDQGSAKEQEEDVASKLLGEEKAQEIRKQVRRRRAVRRNAQRKASADNPRQDKP